MHVTERPMVALASGMAGSRDNNVTRIHPSSLLSGALAPLSSTLSTHSPKVAARTYQGYILAGPVQGIERTSLPSAIQ